MRCLNMQKGLRLVSVNLPKGILKRIDVLVRDKDLFISRSQFMRQALLHFLENLDYEIQYMMRETKEMSEDDILLTKIRRKENCNQLPLWTDLKDTRDKNHGRLDGFIDITPMSIDYNVSECMACGGLITKSHIFVENRRVFINRRNLFDNKELGIRLVCHRRRECRREIIKMVNGYNDWREMKWNI